MSVSLEMSFSLVKIACPGEHCSVTDYEVSDEEPVTFRSHRPLRDSIQIIRLVGRHDIDNRFIHITKFNVSVEGYSDALCRYGVLLIHDFKLFHNERQAMICSPRTASIWYTNFKAHGIHFSMFYCKLGDKGLR